MNQIKTIVVLVQENRSFDHILGWMKSLNPEIDGVTGQEYNPISTTDPNSPLVHFGDRSGYFDLDPGHSVPAIYEQVYGVPYSSSTPITPSTPPQMNGFAQQAEEEQKGLSEIVMNGFKPELVPVFKELVMNFAVCDRWFASLPASTQPNRQYVHSATSHGLLSNDTKRLVAGMPQKTIFDSLDEEGRSFGIYYQDPPTILFYRNLRKLKYVPRFHQYDLHFKNHCKKGKLPNYVVIEQRYFDLKHLPANDDHPKHDIYEGQKLVKEVYEALRSSPQWNEILFVIIYDEHGGLYDHVPTPVGVPSPDDIDSSEPFNFKFDRLGVRVPAIFISPWIESGSVLHKPAGPYPSSEFEHSSIPATVKKIFNLKEFLTKRDAWAGTFETLLTRTSPRTDCPVTLAEPVRTRKTEEEKEANLTEFQQELVQMGAVLNGHHSRDDYPHKIAEGMTVAQGARYMQDGMKKFLAESEKCRKNGADESHVVAVSDTKGLQKQQSFAAKLFRCLPLS